MGNTLRISAHKHRTTTSKKGRRIMEDLSGLEIVCEQDDVSEIFTMPEKGRRGGGAAKEMNDQSHTLSTVDISEVDIYGPRSSCTSDKTRRSKRSSVDPEDLAACIIPGMDPLEMLKLVEECQREELREKELEDSSRGHSRRLSRKQNKRAVKGRRRTRHTALTSGAA